MPPVPPPAAKKPSHRKAWFTHGAAAVIALGVGAAIGGGDGGGGGGGGNSGGTAAAPAPTVTVTAAAKAAAKPAPAPTVTVTAKAPKPPAKPAAPKKAAAPTFSGDGEYLVGQDIKAGTYKTQGPGDSPLCYWERDKDAKHELNSIIANNALTGSGRVTVQKGEIFKTQGCEAWTKVG
jgi:hypothetical protein